MIPLIFEKSDVVFQIIFEDIVIAANIIITNTHPIIRYFLLASPVSFTKYADTKSENDSAGIYKTFQQYTSNLFQL